VAIDLYSIDCRIWCKFGSCEPISEPIPVYASGSSIAFATYLIFDQGQREDVKLCQQDPAIKSAGHMEGLQASTTRTPRTPGIVPNPVAAVVLSAIGFAA
jgi:hypothetical protein